MEQLQVTSLEQLKQVKRTVIISLGKFEDGTEFVAELQRPDLMELAKEGKIPNALLQETTQVFNGTTSKTINKVIKDDDTDAFTQLGDLLDLLVDISLVTPTSAQLKEIDLKLTFEMKMSILTFVQSGVEGLKNFRKEQENIKNIKPGEEVQPPSVGDSKN